jgi:hypothetical protein
MHSLIYPHTDTEAFYRAWIVVKALCQAWWKPLDTAGAVPGSGVLSVHLGRFLRLNELDELKPRCKFGL